MREKLMVHVRLVVSTLFLIQVSSSMDDDFSDFDFWQDFDKEMAVQTDPAFTGGLIDLISRNTSYRSNTWKVKPIIQEELVEDNEVSLRDSNLWTYEVLSSSKHGRHLLLLSLLEKVHESYWYPRSDGLIQLFLPASLAYKDQPSLVATGQLLKEIRNEDGNIMTRGQVVKTLNDILGLEILHDSTFSRLNKEHLAVVRRLIKMLSREMEFDSMLSMLVILKEFIPTEMFVDCVYSVIQMRDDVGFVVPNIVTVQPEDYLPGGLLEEIVLTVKNKSGGGRVKRNVGGEETEVIWNHGKYKTMHESNPESQLWYFHEDPLINANHFHWHQVLSNGGEWGQYSHSSNMDRRGEMFYFMHKQLLCRTNAERLSVGLDISEPFGLDKWSEPIYPGYDAKLGTGPGGEAKYPSRPPGAEMFIYDQRLLKRYYEFLMEAIDEGVLTLFDKTVNLEYRSGVDFGISTLGDVIESYIGSKYGDLHNTGHTTIAGLHKSFGEGIMSSPSVAFRDPLFGRWHKFIDDVFIKYKRSLGYYSDNDLDFPGVALTKLTIQTEHIATPNYLMTHFNHRAFIKLNSLDFKTDFYDSSVTVKYSRLEYIPFTYKISAHSTRQTRGMVRIFLIPVEFKMSPIVDITQLAIEVDRFHVNLRPGNNVITRKSADSSFLAKQRDSLHDLQKKLKNSIITEDEFNWSGCGWPKTMPLPRGKEGGMPFHVFVMLSPLLANDKASGANWRNLEKTSWSWCGVRTDEGGMPDSRPMGFPLDRPPPQNSWKSLLTNTYGLARKNMIYQGVSITFNPDPWGLAKEYPK